MCHISSFLSLIFITYMAVAGGASSARQDELSVTAGGAIDALAARPRLIKYQVCAGWGHVGWMQACELQAGQWGAGSWRLRGGGRQARRSVRRIPLKFSLAAARAGMASVWYVLRMRVCIHINPPLAAFSR